MKSIRSHPPVSDNQDAQAKGKRQNIILRVRDIRVKILFCGELCFLHHCHGSEVKFSSEINVDKGWWYNTWVKRGNGPGCWQSVLCLERRSRKNNLRHRCPWLCQPKQVLGSGLEEAERVEEIPSKARTWQQSGELVPALHSKVWLPYRFLRLVKETPHNCWFLLIEKPTNP